MNLIINTDGASRGNPGPASYGYIIKNSDGVILHQEGQPIGINTNNVAEYSGVLKALEYINEHFSSKAPHQIEVVADSQLIIRQLAGMYKIKSPTLTVIYNQIKQMEFDLGEVSYRHVLRAENYIADKLANQALDRR